MLLVRPGHWMMIWGWPPGLPRVIRPVRKRTDTDTVVQVNKDCLYRTALMLLAAIMPCDVVQVPFRAILTCAKT